MKKLLAITLSLLMMVGMLAGCGAKDTAPAETKAPAAEAPATEAAEASYMEELIAAAQAEGTLVVYGSCEEESSIWLALTRTLRFTPSPALAPPRTWAPASASSAWASCMTVLPKLWTTATATSSG